MLTSEQAAEIARRAGLGIADAVALRALADDPATAEKIAQKFAAESDGRDLAQAVFGPRATDDDTDEATDPDDDLRKTARKLFN